MQNMKASSLTIQKLWPIVKFFSRQANKTKTICPQSIDAIVQIGSLKRKLKLEYLDLSWKVKNAL